MSAVERGLYVDGHLKKYMHMIKHIEQVIVK